MAGITTLPKVRDVDVLRGPETGAMLKIALIASDGPMGPKCMSW
jgi:hypothetical protein